MIVIPGFVDSHLHAWAGQLRGLAPAVDLETYMGLTHEGAAPHYRPHDVYVGISSSKASGSARARPCGTEHHDSRLCRWASSARGAWADQTCSVGALEGPLLLRCGRCRFQATFRRDLVGFDCQAGMRMGFEWRALAGVMWSGIGPGSPDRGVLSIRGAAVVDSPRRRARYQRWPVWKMRSAVRRVGIWVARCI
jgi:hypothetical protein